MQRDKIPAADMPRAESLSAGQRPLPDFASVLCTVCDAFRPLESDISLVISRQAGGAEKADYPERLSAHTRLVLTGALQQMEAALTRLPLVEENALPWACRIEYHHKKRNPVDFHVYLGHIEVTRPAAPRLPMAAEMLNGLRDRLARIARDCGSEAGISASYFVRADSRHDLILPARSAREAAWLYSALYLRNRREIREWEKALDDITQVSRISPAEDWRAPRAPGRAP